MKAPCPLGLPRSHELHPGLFALPPPYRECPSNNIMRILSFLIRGSEYCLGQVTHYSSPQNFWAYDREVAARIPRTRLMLRASVDFHQARIQDGLLDLLVPNYPTKDTAVMIFERTPFCSTYTYHILST